MRSVTAVYILRWEQRGDLVRLPDNTEGHIKSRALRASEGHVDGSWDTVAIGLLVIAVMGAAKREFTHERPSVRFFQWWSRSSIAAMAAMPVGLRAPAAPPGGDGGDRRQPLSAKREVRRAIGSCLSALPEPQQMLAIDNSRRWPPLREVALAALPRFNDCP